MATTNRELLIGKVIKELYAFGSKSERDAHMLVVGREKLMLRRAGENAMSDPGLDKFVGKRIAGYGYRHLGHFVMDSCSFVKPKNQIDGLFGKLLVEPNRTVEFSEEMIKGIRVCKATVYKNKSVSFVGPEDLTHVKREFIAVYAGDNWNTVMSRLSET